MIVMEKQARYHLSYLKTLKPIRQGQYDNEVLNDGIHRVLLARIGKADGMDYDNQVTIEVDERGNGSWKLRNEYPADTGPGYCVPWCTGLNSTGRRVAKRITDTLTALGHLESNVMRGDIADDANEFRMALMYKLIAQGWRISATDNGWKVLPPREGVRNDNA